MRGLAEQLQKAHALLLNEQVFLFEYHMEVFVTKESRLDERFFDDYYEVRQRNLQEAQEAIVNEDREILNWLERAQRGKISPGPNLQQLLDAGMTKEYLYSGLRQRAQEYQIILQEEDVGGYN